MFEQYPSNDRQMWYQRNATRLYILLIIISLIILTFYSSVTSTTHRQIVQNPTESQYIHLQQIYTDGLYCPCKTVSMPYSIFIMLEPYYHQVCSSDMVSERWIRYLQFIDGFGDTPVAAEYRFYARPQFQLLSEFCKQTRQTIEDALPVFLETQFVSSRVISRTLFEYQVNSSIENWKRDTINQFQSTVRLFRAIVQANELTDGTSDVAWSVNYTTGVPQLSAKMYSNCSCDLSLSCNSMMYLADPNSKYGDLSGRFHVPNFFMGCSPLEALSVSTLECFYNRPCMVQIHNFTTDSDVTSFNFSALNSSLNTPSENIGTILGQLMVDSWSSNCSFSSYYNMCAPLSCTFEYNGRNNFFVIITTVISIFGGLSLGYKLLISITLQLIEKLKNGFSYVGLKHFIKNLFSCRDAHQTVARLHVWLVLASLCILCGLISFIPRSLVIQIQKPTLYAYMDLLARFPNSLQCPCTSISIQRNTFLSIRPQFHQVCSSDFVSDDWSSYLSNESNLNDQLVPNDFKNAARRQFQMLASFCQLCQETANNMSLQYGAGSIITNDLLSPDSFNERMRINVDQFQAMAPNSFVNTLSLVRQMTGANALLSALSTSWMYLVDVPQGCATETCTQSVVYQGCNCGTSMKCVQSSGSMLKGCYLLEALLQWPLQCLYDQRCIDPSATFEAMNRSASPSSRFSTNATAELLVNQLMIEKYSINMSYETYFAKCSPSSCSYTYIDKSNVIDGLTNLIAFYGGLVIICRVIAMISVKIFWRPRTRVIPVVD